MMRDRYLKNGATHKGKWPGGIPVFLHPLLRGRQYPPSEFFPAFFLMIFGLFRLVEPNGEKSFASGKIEDEIRESTKPKTTRIQNAPNSGRLEFSQPQCFFFLVPPKTLPTAS